MIPVPMYPYPPDYYPFPWGFHEPRHDMYTLSPKIHPPCNTLYVAGIDPLVSEADLTRVFGTVVGFKRLKIAAKDSGVFAFVEYSDIQSATQALYSFHGYSIGSGQIRVEFAKSKMGEKGKMFVVSQPNGEGSGTD
eukprot:TRINITY_DN2155_c0_g1_i3.p1 TRINITY_DN2155_c0_g1~~TRINITY_DN2155_c0_g1_i3.p1  ORF type:complete len:136 (-),score=16.34 TRINITY_DN2155_c0_g1_i3:35-442(-)